MSVNLQFETQQAIDNILVNDSTLLALLGTGDALSILDNPTQYQFENNPYPFITYDTNEAEPFDSKTQTSQEIFIQISAWSRSSNKKEAMDIISRIYTLLHNVDLSSAGINNILTQQTGSSRVMEDDSLNFVLYHGIIEFRIIMEAI